MGIFAILLLIFIFLIFLLRYLAYRDQIHFESKKIFYYGNGFARVLSNLVKGVIFVEDFNNLYKKIRNQNVKLGGGTDLGQISLVIVDPDLIKSVLVKDFDHFVDKRPFTIPKNDYLLSRMLIMLKGDNWKGLRSKLSPTFTTGKIKRLFTLFDQSGKKLVKFVEEEMASSKTGDMDLTTGFSKFTMDIIASAACGIDSQAFDQKEASLFEEMGFQLQLKFGGLNLLKLIVIMMAPKISDFFGFSLFPVKAQQFFSSAIKSSLKHRRDNKEKRDDFVQLMMEAKEGTIKSEESELDTFEKEAKLDLKETQLTRDLLNDTDIVANCVLFILAGFDTTQSLLLFCAYALALNQDVQDKLRKEVDQVLEDNGGEFSYDSLHKMSYLDMVINETLRFYPPAAVTDRGCTQDYKVPGTEFVLKKGEYMLVPIMGLHHDPQYFPDPEKFDPERFSAENKSKINPYTFLPFGQGPRNCIGMRFALTEVKVAIAHLVHNFRIEPSNKTLIPMKYQNIDSLKPVGGMHLALNKL